MHFFQVTTEAELQLEICGTAAAKIWLIRSVVSRTGGTPTTKTRLARWEDRNILHFSLIASRLSAVNHELTDPCLFDTSLFRRGAKAKGTS